jgi:hypothetical protein
MIIHQQKDGKKTTKVGSNEVQTNTPEKKNHIADRCDMTINLELDKFSGDEFVPAKYKEAEIHLVNSILPSSSHSLK